MLIQWLCGQEKKRGKCEISQVFVRICGTLRNELRGNRNWGKLGSLLRRITAKVRRTVASGACLNFHVKFLGVEIGHPKMDSEPESKVSLYGQFRKGIRHFPVRMGYSI
jgi:hypothetical protein